MDWHVHIVVGGRGGYLPEYCLGEFETRQEAEAFREELIDHYFGGVIRDSMGYPSALQLLRDYHIEGEHVYSPFVLHAEEVPRDAYCDDAPE